MASFTPSTGMGRLFAQTALDDMVKASFVASAMRRIATVTLPTPPAIPRPKLAYNCPPRCSLSVGVIGAKNAGILKEMRENGAGRPAILRRASELLGRAVPQTVVQRHLTHYVELKPDEPDAPEGPRPTDLVILDGIIFAGFKNSRNWKPTIRDTLDAMKLKAQMTGQSAFEDMLQAMNEAFELPDEPEPEIEAPEAVFAPEERLDPPLDGE